MKLIAYAIPGHQNPIRPAPRTRPWMDATGQRFAYRCLPLTIANTYGWEICCPEPVRAIWNGGHEPDDIHVDGVPDLAMSHFGWGVLTFFPGYLFRTEPGTNLLISGPFNHPKRGIAPLTGMVETDWAPYHFTMNWQMTEPGREVVFDAGEPFCVMVPQARHQLSVIQPEIRDLQDDPDLEQAHHTWLAQREVLLNRRVAGEVDWDKNYTHGRMPDGTLGCADHQQKLSLAPFTDHRDPQNDTE